MRTEEYLKLAAVEDRMWYFRALHRHLAREVGRALPTGRGVALDAGCGTGGFILSVRHRWPGIGWTGLDFAPLACELARERTGGPIVEGSVCALPFADASFDVVTSADVLYQIERPIEALMEMRRVLRPGGRLVINVPALSWLWSYHDDSVQSKHRFHRAQLITLLREAGLTPLYATYRNFVVFPLVVVKRKLLPRSDGESDVRPYGPVLERCFDALMALEHGWMSRRWRLPIGSSVFAVAERPRD